jgi:hypothetical protein
MAGVKGVNTPTYKGLGLKWYTLYLDFDRLAKVLHGRLRLGSTLHIYRIRVKMVHILP